MAFKLASDAAAYVVVNTKPDVLEKSSSGGAFSLLAEYVLEQGGIVYGCAFDEHQVARHIRVDSREGLAALRGSKYVQSDMGDNFGLVKKDLTSGIAVLFTGTPCQVDGLRAFLGKDYDQLLCADIVCHGVPSPEYFADYLRTEYGEDATHIKSVEFRDKRQGWTTSGGVRFDESAGCNFHYLDPAFSTYYGQFLAGEIYRESCYRCPYANTNRVGDFTIADFWGLNQKDSGVDADGGASLVLINNQKAVTLAPFIFKSAICEERPLEEATAGNSQLNAPVPRPKERDEIMKLWLEEGMEEVTARYKSAHLKRLPKWLVKRMLHIISGGA